MDFYKNLRKIFHISRVFLIIIYIYSLLTINNKCYSVNNNSVKVSLSLKDGNQILIQEIWNKSIGCNKYYTTSLVPIYNDGVIYTANCYGVVTAFDINNSKKLWQINLLRQRKLFSQKSFSYEKLKLSSGPVINHYFLYVGSEQGVIYALNIKNGNLCWSSQINGPIISNLIIFNNSLLVHTSNNLLQSIDANNGFINWTVSLGNQPLISYRGESSPVVCSNTIIVRGNNGEISAISLDHGEVIWQNYLTQSIISHTNTESINLSDVYFTPIITNNKTIYILDNNRQLLELDLISGQIKRLLKINSIYSFLVDKKNNLYLLDNKSQVYALDSKGKILWIQDKLINCKLTIPAMYNTYLIMGDTRGYIYFMDTINGQFSVMGRDCSGFISKPIIFKNIIIMQSRKGVIHVFSVKLITDINYQH